MRGSIKKRTSLEKKDILNRLIDPEPFLILLAILAGISATAGSIGATVAVLNYYKTHHKPLPTQVRKSVLATLNKLEGDIKKLKLDILEIEKIFREARFSRGATIALGNGAKLSEEDFQRYLIVSDRVLKRLRSVHKRMLDTERESVRLEIDSNSVNVTNVLGETEERIRSLLVTKDLSNQRAWRALNEIATGLENIVRHIRDDLRGT